MRLRPTYQGGARDFSTSGLFRHRGPNGTLSRLLPSPSFASEFSDLDRQRPMGSCSCFFTRRCALANQQTSLSGSPRPLLPDANALLDTGRRAPRADVAITGWKCLWDCDAFPRTNRFHDDIDPGHRAVDLALYAVDLGLQELLHFLQ